ncbi:MAG TPA: hypothetical protein VFU43_22540 [Streptosporangiaceae bacterium]|nr:hypothetical protein [Streptosporangiaceae bacterium]
MQQPKDERLVELAERHNVAQFVSFSPGGRPRIRHNRIRGHSPDHLFTDPRAAVDALMRASAGSLNVRSFRLGRDKGNPFEYGVRKTDEVVDIVQTLAADGYYVIVNETIDTADGGVSGVVLGDLIEFAPLDTPRGVEKPGAVSLPYQLGSRLLQTVYGFRLDIRAAAGERVEFSVHPTRVGYRRGHVLLWEIEHGAPIQLEPAIFWPNRFSRFIGDKAYGLLIAHLLGLPVPATTVIARTVAPFRLGRPTGTAEMWLRTCPTEQRPGHFTTTFGWEDPYALLAREDPDGSAISAVLAQEGVDARYSGASLPGPEGDADYVEGVPGRGDEFMQGRQRPDRLPAEVVRDVRALAARARQTLGPVRLEFVHDGRQAWVVQLHLSAKRYQAGVINPGTPADGWLEFDPSAGLDELNSLIDRAVEESKGVRVVAPVGLTSHVGDLLRRANVPAEFHLQGAAP